MTKDTLAAAKKAAQEFLLRVAALERDEAMVLSLGLIAGTRHTSAVRRQSMELTRALANMRRS